MLNLIRPFRSGRKQRDSRRSRLQRERRSLAIEPLEHRQMLSVTSISNDDVAFHTEGQNMWARGPEVVIEAEFSKTLLRTRKETTSPI